MTTTRNTVLRCTDLDLSGRTIRIIAVPPVVTPAQISAIEDQGRDGVVHTGLDHMLLPEQVRTDQEVCAEFLVDVYTSVKRDEYRASSSLEVLSDPATRVDANVSNPGVARALEAQAPILRATAELVAQMRQVLSHPGSVGVIRLVRAALKLVALKLRAQVFVARHGTRALQARTEAIAGRILSDGGVRVVFASPKLAERLSAALEAVGFRRLDSSL